MALTQHGYTPDRAQMLKMLQSHEISRAMVATGRRVQANAQALAPSRSGSYGAAFSTTPQRIPTLSRRGGAEMRAGAEVVNTAPHASTVEKSHGVLRKAAKRTRGT